MKYIIYFLFFAFLGVAHEVFWRSILDYKKKKNKRMLGDSSLWMFPIYGTLTFIILFVQTYFGDFPWYLRGLLYTLLIFTWEYISGYIIKKISGISPWDYSKETTDGVGSPKKYHLHGLICLQYAPIWYLEGLLAEWIYLWMESNVNL